jgi:hypothetical protein
MATPLSFLDGTIPQHLVLACTHICYYNLLITDDAILIEHTLDFLSTIGYRRCC